MVPFRTLRQSPHFARAFAHVHPLFWPVLWWSLNRLLKWYETAGYENVLYSITRFGLIRIAFYGARTPEPGAYQPLTPTRAHWSDPVWATATPAIARALAARDLTPGATFILPRQAGGSICGLCPRTAGALALPALDTS
jgi:hypothetical protein